MGTKGQYSQRERVDEYDNARSRRRRLALPCAPWPHVFVCRGAYTGVCFAVGIAVVVVGAMWCSWWQSIGEDAALSMWLCVPMWLATIVFFFLTEGCLAMLLVSDPGIVMRRPSSTNHRSLAVASPPVDGDCDRDSRDAEGPADDGQDQSTAVQLVRLAEATQPRASPCIDPAKVDLCPVCRVWVEDLVHHNSVLGVCVGRGNHSLAVAFFGTAALLALVVLTLCLPTVVIEAFRRSGSSRLLAPSTEEPASNIFIACLAVLSTIHGGVFAAYGTIRYGRALKPAAVREQLNAVLAEVRQYRVAVA